MKILLPSLALATSLTAMAVSPVNPGVVKATDSPVLNVTGRMSHPISGTKVAGKKSLGSGLELQTLTNAKGLTFKRLVKAGDTKKSVTPVKPFRKMSATSEPGSLMESFEGAAESTDSLWLPDGWENLSEVEWVPDGMGVAHEWTPMTGGIMLPAAYDGTYMMSCNFSTNEKDEWLVSPYVTVGENYHLTYAAYVDPVFLFIIDQAHVDFDTFEFISQELAANLQILVQVEGEEWTVVRDYFEEWNGVPLSELFDATPSALEKEDIDLSAYTGKNIRVAFRYYGTDGNTMLVDAVEVNAQPLEVKMSLPFQTLFYGIAKSEQWSYLTMPLAVYPVHEALTWTNALPTNSATYLWTYHNPETNDLDFAFTDDLTVTYAPDYSSDFTRRNNLYYPPVLEGFMEGYGDGKAEMAQKYLQMGGKAEFEIQGEVMPFSFLPFDPVTQSLIFLSAEPMDYGQPAVPIFGHSEQSKEWWTNHYYEGDQAEGDSFEINAILNFIYVNQNAPLVVNGGWVNAMGQVTEDAEFKLELISLNDEFVQDSVLATATCLGQDVLSSEGGVQSYLTVPFQFDAPVVLDSSCPAYIVKMSGFNSDAVPYFGPMQSYISHPDQLCHGFAEALITYNGNQAETLLPMANFATDLGECYGAFAINLDAYYPWLDCETKSVGLNSDGTVEIPLGTYFDGSELTVDAPSCYEVSVTGRYDSAVLSVKLLCEHETIHKDTITVSGPGCSVSVVVDQSVDAIDSVTGESSATVVATYNASGVEVKDDRLPAGIYIQRMSDGSTRKVAVK